MANYYTIDDIKSFLKLLMQNNIVEALILPLKTFNEKTYHPFLIKDINLIDNSEPISPTLTINTAREVSKLTLKGALPFKTGVLLKPCELRAFRELIKLNQITPENLITISFDCKGVKTEKYDSDEVREICQICKNFTPDYADIKIFSFQENEKLIIKTDIDLSSLKLEKIEFNNEDRIKKVESILKEKIEKRNNKLNEIKKEFKELLKNCISCQNCMRVCPICFCQECFFSSPALKGDSVTYLMRANRLNGLKFPENKFLFHLGRMNHMSVSCVSCGVCEEACPADIPISIFFAAAGDELRNLFNYEPGRDIQEKIPFTCYEHDELHDFEKPYF